MNISIILAHPNMSSFNHAIANTTVKILKDNGHQVIYHDLYAERFDPLLMCDEFPQDAYLSNEIRTHCEEISSADGIIIIHPNWWGQPPAILKGWIDRVIRPGTAYQFAEDDDGDGIPIGLLKAETALVFNTANTPSRREMEIFGDPLERLWRNCIFQLCGVRTFYRRMYRVVVKSSIEQRLEWLAETEDIVNTYFPAVSLR